jgi:hypothetical protein
MDNINPLNPLLGKIERYEQADSQVKQWESSRVEWTLRRLGLEKQRKELFSSSDSGVYNFTEFNRVVDFPVYLFSEPMIGATPIHRDPKSIHPMWFKAFLGLPFVQQYEDKFETLIIRVGKNKPIGMVFPRKGFSQGLIIHNGDWERFVAPQAGCHFFKGGKKHAMNLIVQPYIGFIDHIREGLGWRS